MHENKLIDNDTNEHINKLTCYDSSDRNVDVIQNLDF